MFKFFRITRPPRRPDFTFMGKTYDGEIWEKVPDPSDIPPPGYRGDAKQDMMVRRRKG